MNRDELAAMVEERRAFNAEDFEDRFMIIDYKGGKGINGKDND